MYKRGIQFICILVLLSLCGFAKPKLSAAEAVPLVVRSVGLLDVDGSVLYSVLLASGPDALSQLTIMSVVPDHSTLVEVVSAPPDAVAQNDGTSVTWQVDKLDADIILGPFTYRVTLDDQTAEAQLNVPATVSWEQPTAGSAEAALETGVLKPLAEIGTITIDAKGTLNEKGENDVVIVGDTGIQLYVPAGAISQETTLTFTRQKIDEKSTPSDVVDYWWCASVSITSDPVVQFSLPISLLLPTSRTLTPGMNANFFIRGADDQWQMVGTLPKKSRRAKPDFQRYFSEIKATISPNGNGIMVIAVTHENNDINGVQFTGGVTTIDRKSATVNGGRLPALQIQDGSSNTAIPYIEQDNIIAVLIGKR